MESLYTLVAYLIGLVFLIGVVAHVAGKLKGGDEFGLIERLVAIYVVGALVAWMLEGARGAAPIAALWPALRWPYDLGLWVYALATKK